MQTSQKRARSKRPGPCEGPDDPIKRTRHVDQRGFRGNIHYVSNDNSNPWRRQQVIDTVKREIAVRSTPEHIQLVLFCDASIDHKDKPALPGGYAVVFNEHRPGHLDHGKKVVMGWHMPHMIDNMIGEATAVAQTIQVAGEKLRGAHLASNKIKAATVKVFTDGNQVLQHIDGCAAVKGFRQETFRKAIQLVCEQSHELGCIPGLDVKLELFWVPGHAGVDDNDIADKAAKQILRNPRQGNLFTMDKKKRNIASMPAAIFLPLQHDLEAETRRIMSSSLFRRNGEYQSSHQADLGKDHLPFPSSALSREAAGSLTSTSTPLSPNSDPTGETVTVATVKEMAAAEEAIAVVEDVSDATKDTSGATEDTAAAEEDTSGATEDTAAAEEEEVSATGEELATFELAGGGTLNGDGAVRNDYLTQLEVDIQLLGEMEEALWRELREEVKVGIMKQFCSVITW